MPRVALVQFCPLPPTYSSPAGETGSELNLQRANSFVREAASQGAELICFPEYFLSGVVSEREHWNLAQYPHSHAHLHDEEAAAASHATAEHWLSNFRSLAKELKVDIAVGTIVERALDQDGNELENAVEIPATETEPARMEKRPVLKNVAHYIDWNGEVAGRYTKRNLWWPEKEYLTAGEEDHQVFETRFGKVGMLICWDLAWPTTFRTLLLHGASLVICPTYWTGTDGGPEGAKHNPDSERVYLESLVVTRAFENECAVVFVNVGAPAGCDPADEGANPEGRIGCSQVTVPFKGRIGGAKGPQEEMVIVDVDLSVLEDARKVYGVRRDLIGKLRDSGELPEWVKA
ncbi:hypothetical protein JCM1841_006004 [Sporobolomyces salmonicolor]